MPHWKPISVALAALALLLTPAPAGAAEPIMPLGQVQPGMRCTGLSVIRGTSVSSFDVEVIDVVAGRGPRADGPRILVRVSGPAVEPSGVAFGFSGSPIICPDARGTRRTIGAISEGLGEYGNLVVLATPIEQILAEPLNPPTVPPPVVASRSRAAELARPLMIGGLSRSVARAVERRARRARRPIFVVPGSPLANLPPQDLVPGSAVSIGLSSGDVSVNGIGTVTYRDGDQIWAFGHPFDNAGARSLLLQDAYVYGVISNPIDIPDVGLGSYKLASAGHDLGIFSNDAPSTVVGRLGQLPALVPVRIAARDKDLGREDVTSLQVADETALGPPGTLTGLAVAGELAVVEAPLAVLRGQPARLSGSLCLRVQLRERKAPLRFCNRYVSVGDAESEQPEGLPVLMAEDYAGAVALLENYNFGTLHPQRVDASIDLRRGLRQAFMVGASAPRVVRRGGTARIVLRVRQVGGAHKRFTFRLKVPRSARKGTRTLRLRGSALDPPEGDLLEIALEDTEDVLDEEEEDPELGPGPRSLEELAAKFAGFGRYDGVRARFSGGPTQRAFRHRELRIGGSAETTVRVR